MPNLDGLEAALRIRALEAARSGGPGAACSAHDASDSSDRSSYLYKRRRHSTPISAADIGFPFSDEADSCTACSSYPEAAPGLLLLSACSDPNPPRADKALGEAEAAEGASLEAGYRPAVILAVTCSSDAELWARPVLQTSTRSAESGGSQGLAYLGH